MDREELEQSLKDLYDIWDTLVLINKTMETKNPRLVTLQLDLSRIIDKLSCIIIRDESC